MQSGDKYVNRSLKALKQIELFGKILIITCLSNIPCYSIELRIRLWDGALRADPDAPLSEVRLLCRMSSRQPPPCGGAVVVPTATPMDRCDSFK